MLVMRDTRAYRNPRTDRQGRGRERGRRIRVDTARVTRPPFVHFMGLTLRYDYSRGYCVLLPSLASDALHASRAALT